VIPGGGFRAPLGALKGGGTTPQKWEGKDLQKGVNG